MLIIYILHTVYCVPQMHRMYLVCPMLNSLQILKMHPDAFPRRFACIWCKIYCTKTVWLPMFCPLLPNPLPQFCAVHLMDPVVRRFHVDVLCNINKNECIWLIFLFVNFVYAEMRVHGTLIWYTLKFKLGWKSKM